MTIAVLALGGAFLAAYLTLYHFGYVGQLACGTGGCETVQGSKFMVTVKDKTVMIGNAKVLVKNLG